MEPESATDFDSSYPQNDMSRMTETDTIAPARDVARRKEEYNRLKEEKERAKQEAIEKRAREIEEGIDDHNTNLPLEMLMKQKLEDEIRNRAMGAMANVAASTGDSSSPLTLATTQNTAGTSQIANN